MHCPNCRDENPSTTRFCVTCGAVLVESTPDGRRRRVLRPWGLRRAAPPTESPAMPEIVAVMRATAPPRRWSRRLDVRVGAGTAVAALCFFYSHAGGLERTALAQAAVESPAEIATATRVVTQQTVLSAPPLLERAERSRQVASPQRELVRPAEAPPAPEARYPGSATVGKSLSPRSAPRDTTPAVPDRTAEAVSAPPPAVVAQLPRRPSDTDRVPQAASPAADRWQALRDELAGCAARPGWFERATCAQGARLAHCDGYWGDVALCPAGRTEYGQ